MITANTLKTQLNYQIDNVFDTIIDTHLSSENIIPNVICYKGSKKPLNLSDI